MTKKTRLTKAIVLSAGLGLRLRPITETLPKPLVKVGGRTLLDRALDRLEAANVTSAIVNLHHLGPLIERHLCKRASPEISFSFEETLLETGGGVLNALGRLGPGPFFAVNADTLWLNGSVDALKRMTDAWDDTRMDALLLLHSTVDAYGYEGVGDFTMDPVGRLVRRSEDEVSPYLFTGVQILHPRLFAGEKNGAFSLNRLYDKAIKAGRLYGLVHDGEWFHVGTPGGLAQAEAYMSVHYPGIKHR